MPTLRLLLLTPFLLVAREAYAQRAEVVRPRAGLVITRSVRIQPGTWRIPAPASPDSAAIVVRGDDATVDLTGVTLRGAEPTADPDRGAGVAIRIEGGRNVTVRGGNVRGYKVGILARDTRNLRIEGTNLSHNWKPRMYSLVEHESLADWLSYHQNEKDEWLRFGAGVYLAGVKGGEIRGVTVHQGMNGLLMTRTDSLRVIENDFSFNSGLGIGMYRSSDNTIMHNRVDYDVRGYSHGFYRRGQDSAALLMYEQSCRNVVAFNSMTHGGDGLFLWAGQSTMEKAAGGSNDNLFYANDFSYAPTNGMEATFSRNAFVGNVIKGSDHGLWGGYSYESAVIANLFAGNRIAIAIEHGQDNEVRGNIFDADSTAVRLWANPTQPPDWGYPKHRDTRSRDYQVRGNRFHENRVAVRVVRSHGVKVHRNVITGVDTLIVASDTTAFVADSNETPPERDHEALFRVPDLPPDWVSRVPGPIPGAREVRDSPLALRPRSAIIVDEWGPFDWKSPRLWPIDSTRANPLRLQVVGPEGRWRVVSRRGVASVSKSSGSVPDTISVVPAAGREGDWELALEYVGGRTVSPRGVVRAAGTPVRFSYGRFEPRIAWLAKFFAWDSTADLRKDPGAFARVAATRPIFERELPRLDYMWYRPQVKELPLERWALEASGQVIVPSGAYRLRAISDDGVRVWVDGRLVIDSWAPHESKVDEVPIAPGMHDLKVQYYQVDGWTELRLEVLRER